MLTLSVPTSEAAGAPAGFWKRYVAYSLDAAIVGLPTLALVWSQECAWAAKLSRAYAALQERLNVALDALLLRGEPPPSAALLIGALMDPAVLAAVDAVAAIALRMLALAAGVYATLGAACWIVGERSSWQATLGKRALGLIATDARGARLGWGRAAARHFAGALSWLTLNLGHALAAWTRDGRALHDMIAGTRVVHAPGTGLRMPAWAKAVLALQGAMLLAVLGWLLWRYAVALRAAMELGIV